MPDSPKYPAKVKRSHAKIEEAAARVRTSMGKDPLDRVGGVEFLVWLGRQKARIKGARLPIVYNVAPLSEAEAQARYQPEYKRIICELRPDTYDLLEQGDPRATHSAIHEGGHALLHPLELLELESLPTRARALRRGDFQHLKPYEDVEFQAHSFAGAVRVPQAGLEILESRADLTTDSIVRIYGVSRAAARVRLRIYEKYLRQSAAKARRPRSWNF